MPSVIESPVAHITTTARPNALKQFHVLACGALLGPSVLILLQASLLKDPQCLDAARLATITGQHTDKHPVSNAAAMACTTSLRCAQCPAAFATAHCTFVHPAAYADNCGVSAAYKRVCAGVGVRQLIGWKRDLPQQEERARLVREVSSYCSRNQQTKAHCNRCSSRRMRLQCMSFWLCMPTG
jgi:hypothetical protein